MPLLTRTVDGKNVVKVLAAMKEEMKNNKAIVARCAFGRKRLTEIPVIPHQEQTAPTTHIYHLPQKYNLKTQFKNLLKRKRKNGRGCGRYQCCRNETPYKSL